MHAMLDLLLCAICAGGFAFAAVRRPVIAIGIVLGAWIATFGIRDPLDLSVTVSTTRVFLLDILAGVLLVTAVIRALLQRRWDLGRILVFVLVVLLAIHIGRGVVELGLQTGVNNGRSWTYFVAALAYAATLREFPGTVLWKLVIVAGLILAAIAVPYFFVDGIKSASGQIVHNGDLINWRPVTAAGALMILQAAILMVGLGWPSRSLAIPLASALALILVLLQQRTIWVAGVALLLIAAVWAVASRPQHRRAALAGLAALVAAVLVFVGVAAVVGGAFWDSITEPASKQSTLIWRTDGWGELIRANDAPSQILTGNPAGRGFERVLDLEAVDVQAHNEYVDAYVRFGIVGALVIICLWVLMLLRWRQAGTGSELGGRLALLLVVTQIAFTLTYALDVSQGIVAGALVCGMTAAAAATQPTRADRTPSEPRVAAA